MKSIKVIILLLLFSYITYAQNISGKYYDGSDFIKFTNDSVSLKIKSNGSPIVQLCANGEFQVIEDFLLINTSKYKGEKSIIATSKKKNRLPQIKITDKNGNAIEYVNVVLIDNSGKIVWAAQTNDSGIAIIPYTGNAEKIKISLIGYDEITCNFKNNTDYQIKLMDCEILENETIVFKINYWNNDSLTLTLLSANFTSNENMIKKLHKLEKKTKKYRFAKRQFIKK